MKISCTGLAAAFVLTLAPFETSADPKPRGAKIASSDQITRAYAGKTDLWENDCDGGIYFGGKQQARAWCAEKSESLGAGTWSTDSQGNLCYGLTWYWPNGSRAGASKSENACISHVVDRAGKIWRSWPNDTEWWPLTGSASIVRGYKYQSEVRRTQSNLGI
ncbi:MAG: DUF995 domain-containing protein [Sulfitobacter sp.]